MILVIVSINRVYSTKKKTADMFTFTEEILNGKLHFLCSDLLMVSPFLYNRKESRYPPGGDTLYFDKEVKPYSSKKPTPITISNKTKIKWRKTSIMVSQLHSGSETTYTSSRKYGCENRYIVTIHILKKYQRNSRMYHQLKEKRKIKMNLIHPVLSN